MMPCKNDTEFKCRDTGICIRQKERCDAYENCKDGSDELHCGAFFMLLVA